MRRCIELAKIGSGNVAPNPMVGAVLVYKNRIIGEGYHERFGEAHAEINCISSVLQEDHHLISNSILYVSLEPCAHVGKTPPCVDLILKCKIPHVIIGCRDSFEKVNGTGIQKLLAAGVKVETDVLKEECINLNKRFFTFHQFKRPYIILKWAQTNDGFIDGEKDTALKISNEYSNKLTHKWRSEESAILVGTNTVIKDDPTLTTRNWSGTNPVRIIIDINLKTNTTKNVYNNEAPCVIVNRRKMEHIGNIFFYKIEDKENVLDGFLKCLYINSIISCIIEGGTKTLQSFIDAQLWDEARIITNTSLNIEKGITAPALKNSCFKNTLEIFSDRINFFTKQNNELL